MRTPATKAASNSIAIQFTSNELPAAFARTLAGDDGKAVVSHDFDNLHKGPDKGGANGLQLFAALQNDREHFLFCAVALDIGIQSIGAHTVGLVRLNIFDINAGGFGQLVQGFLVLREVLNVGADDFHSVSFLPV